MQTSRTPCQSPRHPQHWSSSQEERDGREKGKKDEAEEVEKERLRQRVQATCLKLFALREFGTCPAMTCLGAAAATATRRPMQQPGLKCAHCTTAAR